MTEEKSATEKDHPRQRFERLFDDIYAELDGDADKHTRCIVRALEIVALELSELNVAASELLQVPQSMPDVIHHLEQIDANTDETAEPHRQKKSSE